ncbi:hypothetical protein KPSA3_07736 [Pseudomonas syringae pv. actinidiae]|nr:hypothetical protein KPSA3_07736 [Pseudomonas syringae pv. actinidiae]
MIEGMNMSESVARFQIALVQAEIVGGAVFVHCPERRFSR